MPRSKRKAVAARAAASKGQPRDFEKTKTKLGKRKRSDSTVTASAVSSRKIYVPPQAPRSRAAAPSSTAVLVARVRDHYTANARVAALAALARAAADAPTFAADVAPAVRAAVDALVDDAPAVRVAALAALCAALRRVRSVRPFAGGLAAGLGAALSHIRADVRVSAARATVALFELGLFSPAEVFGGAAVNPLPLLVALLEDVGIASAGAKAAAANAIAALSCWDPAEVSARSSAAPETDGHRVFYYQSSRRSSAPSLPRGDSPADALPLLALSPVEAAAVVVGVSNMVLEFLPVAGNPSSALVAAARALSTVVCDSSLSEKVGYNAAARAVEAWATEQVYGASRTTSGAAAADVDTSMAACAAVLGKWDLVSDFVCGRLCMGEGSRDKGAHGWATADSVTWRLLSAGGASAEQVRLVSDAWLENRWQVIVEEGFVPGEIVPADGADEVVALFYEIVTSRLRSGDGDAWSLVLGVPRVLASIVRESLRRKEEDVHGDSADGGVLEQTSTACQLTKPALMLVQIVRDAVRLHEIPSDCPLAESIVEHMVSQKDVLLWLEAAGSVDNVLSSIWYAGAVLSPSVLALLRGNHGWRIAAAVARVVEHACDSSMQDANAGSGPDCGSSGGNSLALVAATLSALLACSRAKVGTSEPDAPDGDTAALSTLREEVESVCTRLLQQNKISQDSIRGVLEARRASESEISHVLGLVFSAC